jgi:hypothetical protein
MRFIETPTEQTTAITDALLFVIAALLGLVAAAAGRRSDQIKGRIWASAFELLATASLFGAIAHGFQMSAQTKGILWMPLNLALGLMVALVVVGAVYDLRSSSLPRFLVPVMVGVGVLFFAVTLVIPGSFLVFVIYEAVAMLFALGVYLRLAARRVRGALLMAAGVLVSMVAAAVQASGAVSFTLIWPFDHNGAFHLMQLGGLALLMGGILRELESRRHGAQHVTGRGG